jgi:competence protein ComEC
MTVLTGKTPFFRLLLPVIAGIVAGFLFPKVLPAALPTALGGLSLMLLSFFVPRDAQYRLRWLFGAGVCLLLFSLSLLQLRLHAKRADLSPALRGQFLLGVVLDIPEAKPRSVAVNVQTAPPGEKKVVLYLEQTGAARELAPGDEIVFRSNVAPFSNSGNPNEFDYAGYMRRKGFAGSGYVAGNDWRKTGRITRSIPVMAQRFRGKALDFYRSFGLESEAFAFVCALTLGYKVHLSNDLQEAFRTSGTAHVLALSGLHVGIIYTFISLLFSFFGKSRRGFFVVAALWAFVFVVGMSASVVRAAIMLTIGSLGRRRGFGYNTLAAAAFLILVFSPYSLFDVGFQMSFAAVFAILFFNPKLKRLYAPSGLIAQYGWGLLCITTSAQLGVFPLALYYFGTFPTWFFVTNLLVVPLAGCIVYATVPLVFFGLLRPLGWNFISVLYDSFQWIEKTLIEILLKIVYFFDSMPFAQLSDGNISLPQLLLIVLFLYPFAQFLSTRRAPPLVVALAALLCFLAMGLFR